MGAAGDSGAAVGQGRSVPTVVVVGDVNLDTVLVPVAADAPGQGGRSGPDSMPEFRRCFRRFRRDGGALLLSRTIRAAVERMIKVPGETTSVRGDTVYSYDRAEGGRTSGDLTPFLDIEPYRGVFQESLTKLALFPRKLSGKGGVGEKESVYRIDQVMGWVDDGDFDKEVSTRSLEDLLKRLREALPDGPKGEASGRPPRVLVINDRDHGFRKIPAEMSLHPFLVFRDEAPEGGAVETPIGPDDVIVLEMEINSKDGKNRLWEEIQKTYLDRTVVVVSIESLRESGVKVRDDVSIERLAMELLDRAEDKDSIFAELVRCPHLVIWFRDGAIHLSNRSARDRERISDYYCPYAEKDLGSSRNGTMAGYTTILVAALVRGIVHSYLDTGDGLAGVPRGVRLGVTLAAQHFLNGFAGKEEFEPHSRGGGKDHRPFEALFQRFDDRNQGPDGAARGAKDLDLSVLSIPRNLMTDAGSAGGKRWRRWSRVDGLLEALAPGGGGPERVAIDVVKRGLDKVVEDDRGPKGGWFPPRRVLCPFLKFGVIETVDQDEIDHFMSLSILMNKYLDDRSWETPLSIAVFGPPGSGKSFTVKQILERISPGHDQTSLEFNVAQFSGVKDLATACHMAQDRALTAKVPLVTFDEFDAKFQEAELGWLKYFLAPMQDGKFKDGDSMYRIGRAIFVFSGGTADSFEGFTARCQGMADSRTIKGPDFVSRLRGHLNIKSIDCGEDSVVDDPLMIRRAILLRSILKRKASAIFDPITGEAAVHEAVIRAFLKAPKYKHGVRSMEAIIEMSQLGAGRALFKSGIPSDAQLEMHVDSREFLQFLA